MNMVISSEMLSFESTIVRSVESSETNAPVITLLYIDDETSMLELTKLFLERTGEFSVTTAESSPKAARLLAENNYDAIVADYRMPGMDGIKLLEQLREKKDITPFIIFSGRGREEVVIEAYEKGAAFYIQKGGDPKSLFADLMHKVKQAVELDKSEQALRESEEKFRTLFETALDAILILDPGGMILFANQAAGRLIDAENYREICGTGNVLDFIAPESREDVLLDFSRVAKGIDGYLARYKVLTTKKQDRWVESIGKNIVVEGRKAIIVSLRDVTDRERAERILRESESKFRTIFENSPYPISINSIPDGKFIAVNPAFLKTSGYSEQDLLEKTPTEAGILSLIEFGKMTARLVTKGKIENEPMAVTGKDGKRIHVLFSTIPVAISGRSAIMTMTAEVTSLKRIEQELLIRNEELHTAYNELAAADEELRINYHELDRKEQSLRESEEKFRALVELSLDGIVISGPSGTILFANHAAGVMVDMPDYQGMIGKMNILDFVAPESKGDVLQDFDKIFRGIDSYLVHYKLITEKRREIWVECVGKQILFGASDAIFISMRDVTERRQAEIDLRESEATLSTLFRSIPIAYAILSSADGKFVDVNDVFLQNTGYAREEVIGKTSDDVGIFADPDVRDHIISSMRRQSSIFSLKTDFRVKAGEIRKGLFSARPVMIARSPHVLFTLEDITDRTLLEDGLSRINDLLLHLGRDYKENVNLLLALCGELLHADCVLYNRLQEGLLYTIANWNGPSDMKIVDHPEGHLCHDVIRGGDNPLQVVRHLSRSRYAFTDPNVAAYGLETYIGCPVRYSGVVHGSLCAVYTRDLEPKSLELRILGMISTAIAQEEGRREADEALRIANKKMNLMGSITRHDVTNQLVMIRAFLDAMDQEISDPSRKQFIDEIGSSSTRISDILEFTREYEQVGVNAPVWQDCRGLIDRAAAASSLGQVSLKNDIPEGTELFADPLIEKVFYNLIENALRHGITLTTIRFMLGNGSTGPILVCEDNGAGIPDDEKEKVFELGYGNHTGYGLFLGREILTITGMSIRETGKAGKGARFELSIPPGMCRFPGKP